MVITTTTVVRIWPCCIVTVTTRHTQRKACYRLVLMTLSLVREEPDEVESLTSGFEAESGEAIPRLRLTIPLHHALSNLLHKH